MTRSKRQTLIYLVVNNCSGSPIQRYLPYVQTGFADELTRFQREELWRAVNSFVKSTEINHFKLIKQPKDYHDERVLAFYELAQARWDKFPAVVCKEYKSAFSEIEAVLQFRRMGIALEDVFITAHRTNDIRQFVRYFEWKRSELPYHVWYQQKYNKEPTETIIRNWNRQVKRLEYCLKMSPVPVFGVPRLLSIEEVEEHGD